MSERQSVWPLIELGRFSEAEQAARRGLTQDPNDAELLYWLSVALLSQDHYVDAIHVAQHAASAAPYWPEPWWTIASANLARSDHRAALAACDHMLALDPNRGEIYALRALVLSHQTPRKRALESLRHAQALSPHDSLVHQLAGEVYLQCRMYPEAEDSARRALVLNPTDSSARTVLGIAVSKQRNRRPEGMDHLVAASRDDPVSDRARDEAVGIARKHMGGGFLVLWVIFRLATIVVFDWNENRQTAYTALVTLAIVIGVVSVVRRRAMKNLPPGLYELVRAEERSNIQFIGFLGFWIGLILIAIGGLLAMTKDPTELTLLWWGIGLAVVCFPWRRQQ